MSIRDRGYKPYEGQFTPLGERWAVVMKKSLRMTARQPWVVAILILSIFWALGWGVVMYIRAKLWAQVPPDAVEMAAAQGISDPASMVYTIFHHWIGTPVLAFLMAMFAGGGAVADDARQGTFQFYFARPMSREQYLVGKVVPVLILVASVSLIPSLLLAVVRLAVARDGSDMAHHLWLLLQSLGLGVIEALALSLPVVALSSLSKSRGYAQGAFATLFLLPWIVGGIFVGITRNPWPALLSLPAQIESLGGRIFGVPIPPDQRALPWAAAAAAMAAILVASVALLRTRLAAAEVVAG